MRFRALGVQPSGGVVFRGNRLFNEAGHAEVLMPPWPSVFSGALRTRMLIDSGVDFKAFARGEITDRRIIDTVGASPAEPGRFFLRALGLIDTSTGTTWFPAPSDLVVFAKDGSPGQLEAVRMRPIPVQELGVRGSWPLPRAAVLERERTGKPESGIWISGEGLLRHLKGEQVDPSELRRASTLWKAQSRVGIGLDHRTRSVTTGAIYSGEVVTLAPGVAFLVIVGGANGLLPDSGLIRLGGDGGLAEVFALREDRLLQLCEVPREDTGGFRVTLATPGLFPGGWLPSGLIRDESGGFLLRSEQGAARLVCAVGPRHGVVSGWDVARGRPKPAEKVMPAGATYWFEWVERDPELLMQLSQEGFWCAGRPDTPEARARRAEGFGQVWVGCW